jgi:thiol-disulfide isomerase/thioredoxin
MIKQFLLIAGLCAGITAAAQPLRKMSPAELNSFITSSQKPLIVSFWATWCGSCVEEIPYFISHTRDKYGQEVDLVLVSLDVKAYFPSKIERFAARRNYTVPIIWMNETNADVFCPLIDAKWSGAIPSTLMVNNKKQYRKFYETGMSPLQFERNLKEMVEGKPATGSTGSSY